MSGGSIVLTLSNPAATVIATGGAATPAYIFNLDSNGNLPVGSSVFGNNELTPQGTFYTLQLFTGPNGTGTLISSQTAIVGPSAPYSGTLYPSILVLPPVSFAGPIVIPSAAVAFSATPAFNAGSQSVFRLTLTGSVTSSTLTGAVTDQLLIFEITQDGIGGHPFVWPTSVKNPQTIDPRAGKKSIPDVSLRRHECVATC